MSKMQMLVGRVCHGGRGGMVHVSYSKHSLLLVCSFVSCYIRKALVESIVKAAE